MEQTPFFVMIIPVLMGILLFIIAVLITRWAFRIDTIVNNQSEQIRLTKLLIDRIDTYVKEKSAGENI
jgi:ABC-type proline/glycine betaine transport system permease subunit